MSESPPSPPPAYLPHDELRKVVRLAPLIAIDLIIRNARGEILLGLRNNEPAKGSYFVPGGMILKNERLREAFARILKRETDLNAGIEDARPLGVYEHFYANNCFGETGYGTHYVVHGYELKIDDTAALKSDDQHSELRWWTEAELLASPHVHHNTKAYFRPT
ncbi:MAG TPA: GDP-mannose mannosyl hydrolase [Xanthobacteraceae bacterium]|nr:GDP-mannose mannosyl hydrolase [Xanthobacteraceae bacterium]